MYSHLSLAALLYGKSHATLETRQFHNVYPTNPERKSVMQNVRDYDLSRSVIARRLLTLEEHSLPECLSQVFGPTARLLLTEIAQQQPSVLLGMHSLTYQQSLGITRQYAEIDLILPDKSTLYLAHVFGKQESDTQWSQPGAPDRWEPWENQHGYFVPVKDTRITRRSCEKAVRVYSEHRCPQLGQLPITWLDDAIAVELYAAIWDEARIS
jgi:hypothetical protein